MMSKLLLIIKIARRSIWRNKRRTLISLFSIVIATGIPTFFVCVAWGFYGALVDDVARLMAGHVTYEHVEYRDSPSNDLWVDDIETINGILNNNDNVESRFGNSGDLRIYHDGTHSYFKNSHTSGSTRFNQKYFEVNNTAGTESMLSAYEDGAVNLRYDGNTKLVTQSGGIQINGNIEIGVNPFAITGESGSNRLTIHENTGAVWIDGSCSAASFIDRTPYPETLQLAYDVINSHQKLPANEYKADDQSKQLDHTKLHEYVSVTTPADLWTENDNLPEGVSVGDIKKEEEKNRNMSGVISCLVEVIRDLSAKNEELTTRIETLEA